MPQQLQCVWRTASVCACDLRIRLESKVAGTFHQRRQTFRRPREPVERVRAPGNWYEGFIAIGNGA